MKALSVRQPWAWLLATGIKDVENRTWVTRFRGRIYIHAGKSTGVKVQGIGDEWIIARLTPDQLIEYRNAVLVRGAIIGEVTISDCHYRHGDMNANLFSKWAEIGLYGYTLTDPKLYEVSIPCRGALGLFQPDIVATGREQAGLFL